MRYMLIHTDDPSLASGWDDEARASAYSWIEKVNRSGVGLQGSPVRPSADATTIKIRDGELVITDGPYAETKEQIAGYDVLECATRRPSPAAKPPPRPRSPRTGRGSPGSTGTWRT